MSREAAAQRAGMDRQRLRGWVIRDSRGGLAGLSDHWGKGRPCRLTEGQQAALQAIVREGPDAELDGLDVYVQPTWRLVDLFWIVRGRFGVTDSETGRGRRMRSLGLSWQTPRPRHADAPLRRRSKQGFAATLAQIVAAHLKAERIAVWFQDEARAEGPHGALLVPARHAAEDGQGSRHRSASILGAACLAWDAGAARVLSRVSVAAMKLVLEEVASQLPPGTHAAMLIDHAGWRTA